MKKSTSGFTIVELLIVIVVIAILAAISVAVYGNIQNRANDTAVQSDINSFAKKVMLFEAEKGRYPVGVGGGTFVPVGMENFPVTKGSYATNVHNFYYCTGTVVGAPAFAVGAVSKSGEKYFFSSIEGSLKIYAGSWASSSTNCPGMLPELGSYTYSYGYNTSSGWGSWTQ